MGGWNPNRERTAEGFAMKCKDRNQTSMSDIDIEAAIADVFAMMGGTATLSGHTTERSRSVQDKKRYRPKTEFGKRLEATVAQELARIRAERDPSP